MLKNFVFLYSQIWHLFAHATLGYIATKYISQEWMTRITFVIALGYLAMARDKSS